MPQPSAAVPPARRTAPGQALQEAVMQRDQSHCLLLCQQWVHRRGIADLRRFCQNQLRSELGDDAVAWLQASLEREEAAPSIAAAGSAAQPAAPNRVRAAAGPLLADEQPRPIPALAAAAPSAAAGSWMATPAASADDGAEPAAASAPNPPAGLMPPVAEPAEAPSADLPERQPGAAAPGPADVLPLTSLPPCDDDTAEVAATGTLEPAGARELEPVQPVSVDEGGRQQQVRAQHEAALQERAEAAVEAAFAALAQSFPEAIQEAAADADPAEAPLPQQPVSGAPLPIPPAAAVWPALNGSAASVAANLQRHGNGAQPPHNRGDVPATPATVPAAALRPADPARAAATPQPSPPAAWRGSEQPTAAAAGAREPEPAEIGAPAQTTGTAEAPAAAGLMGRLRARLSSRSLPQLSRLRQVMRDCVEETVALLHSSDEELTDASDPEVSPGSGAAWEAAPPPPIGVSDPSAPLPKSASEADTPFTAGDAEAPRPSPVAHPGAAAPQPFRLRLGLLGRRPTAAEAADRPAPAPPGLSDLRAWLPDRGDLPRAS